MKSVLIVLALAVFAYGGVVPENFESSGKAQNAKFTVEIRSSVLWFWSTHLCNGALIDGEFVLSPAQCVARKSWYSSFKVVIGSKTYGVRDITIHENADNIANDIALVRLSSTVTYSETVTPVNLPFSNAEFTDTATLYKRQSSGEVRTDNVSVKSRSDCTGAPAAVTSGHICAGDDKTSAVAGEEGSSLAVSDGLTGDVLIGLVSFAKPEPAPAVFTKISYHTNWILEKLEKA